MSLASSTNEPATSEVPGLEQGVRANLRYDLPAGLVVFLVALPLCLGIALACGAPLISGLIAGIVAGLVVAPLSGSQVSVSGPAAGLTVIVIDALAKLGSFRAFLLAVVIGGVGQLALGVARAGFLANFFPSSVIKGMLSAIGIVLILKQIPHALGYDKDPEGDIAFSLSSGENTFSELLNAFAYLSPTAIVITALSLALLWLWPKVSTRFPAPLLVVLVSVALHSLLAWLAPSMRLAPEHMVSLPVAQTPADLAGYISLPDFSQLANPKVYLVGVTLTLVASLESLLSVEAVSKLDPFKRPPDTNRELFAQGTGNIVSGLLGGLPLTAVIIRSSANVNAGARTKTSAIVHGVLLLAAVVVLPAVLNHIPLSAVAAVLLVTGFKLVSPSVIRSVYRGGHHQFVPFLVTVVAILFTDLLKGIGIGMVVGIFYLLRDNYRTAYFLEKTDLGNGGYRYDVTLSEHVSFLNKAHIVELLESVPENSIVKIDGSKSTSIDRDVIEFIQEWGEGARNRGVYLEVRGIEPAQRTAAAH